MITVWIFHPKTGHHAPVPLPALPAPQQALPAVPIPPFLRPPRWAPTSAGHAVAPSELRKGFRSGFFPKKSPKREIHSIEGSSRVDKTLKPANKKLHQFEVHVSCGTPPFKILFFADLTVFWMGSVVDKHLISLAVIHHIRYAYVSWNEVIETKPSLTYTISLGTEHIGGWFMSSEIIGLISSLQANSSVTCSRGIFVSHPLIGTSISIYTSSLKFQHKTDI